MIRMNKKKIEKNRSCCRTLNLNRYSMAFVSKMRKRTETIIGKRIHKVNSSITTNFGLNFKIDNMKAFFHYFFPGNLMDITAKLYSKIVKQQAKRVSNGS